MFPTNSIVSSPKIIPNEMSKRHSKHVPPNSLWRHRVFPMFFNNRPQADCQPRACTLRGIFSHEEQVVEFFNDYTKTAAWDRKDADIIWSLGEEIIGIEPYFRTSDYLHLRTFPLSHKCARERPPYFCLEEISRGDLVRVVPALHVQEQEANLCPSKW